MNIRSFLFVPGDSEKKLGKADCVGADALILDLEDAVSPTNKTLARELTVTYLRERPRNKRVCGIWVRINPLSSALALADLVAVVNAAPDGVILPKVNGPKDTLTLSHYLDALEVQGDIPLGSIRIVPVATETPTATFRLGDYTQACLPRLLGLTWGAEDLSSAVGASTNLSSSGQWALTYRLVRSLTLLAASATGVQAIDTAYTDFRDHEGLRAASRASRAEGFTGRIAIHPAQVALINESYLPTAQEIEHAYRVIAAFEAAGGAGICSLDGRMLDIPHLKQATKIIATAEAYK